MCIVVMRNREDGTSSLSVMFNICIFAPLCLCTFLAEMSSFCHVRDLCYWSMQSMHCILRLPLSVRAGRLRASNVQLRFVDWLRSHVECFASKAFTRRATDCYGSS